MLSQQSQTIQLTSRKSNRRKVATVKRGHALYATVTSDVGKVA